jgi:hypothetical protein
MIPSREDIESLKVGDVSPDCFGRMSKVTEIFARKDDINGRAFVCYYTAFGASGSCSHRMKEGDLLRTVATSNAYTSAELDAIERKANQERAAAPAA